MYNSVTMVSTLFKYVEILDQLIIIGISSYSAEDYLSITNWKLSISQWGVFPGLFWGCFPAITAGVFKILFDENVLR